MLEADAAARAETRGEERPQLSNAAVGVVRTDGLGKVPIQREGFHNRFDVTNLQRGLVAADDITGVGRSGLEYGRPDVALYVDRPLAAVGAEHHRQIVGDLATTATGHASSPRRQPGAPAARQDNTAIRPSRSGARRAR